MDPDKVLEDARAVLARIRSKKLDYEDDAFDLADAFEALDAWMSNGGFSPKAWKRIDDQPNVEVAPQVITQATKPLVAPLGAAAYWVRNLAEPVRYAAYELRWSGRQIKFPHRKVNGRRATNEMTVLDDLAAIFRYTCATYVTLRGIRHARNSMSDTILGYFNRRSLDKEVSMECGNHLHVPWPLMEHPS
jgi:hypothetical protein